MPEIIDIKVPELGKVNEINMIEWKVTSGDEVTEGMELAEIETMKSTFSVDAPADGTIEDILVDQGEKVKIDQSLATMKINK